MKNRNSFLPLNNLTENNAADIVWSPTSLQPQSVLRNTSSWEWWYRLTATSMSHNANAHSQLDTVQQSRLNSLTALLIACSTLVLTIPLALLLDRDLLVIPCILIGFISVALAYNQRGKVTSAGILIVAGLAISLMSSLFLAPGILNNNSLALYDLLLLTELVAVLLLPAKSVFMVASLNSLFIALDLTLQQHAPNLTPLLASSRIEIYARPILLQLVVAIVGYIWTRSLKRANTRANKAEAYARHHYETGRQFYIVSEQKQQLETSIQQLVDTHRRFAMGDLNARVPLTPDNLLWGIAASLNTLLSRLQKLLQCEVEYQKLQPRLHRTNQIEYALSTAHHEVQRLTARLRQAKTLQRPLLIEPGTGTLLDPFLTELNGCYLLAPDQLPRTDKIESINTYTTHKLEEMHPRSRSTVPLPRFPSSHGTTSSRESSQDIPSAGIYPYEY